MMEMRFNITTSEYGDVNEYQIKQIVCTAINNMLWYFIEIAIAANLIFFILVMGCMYFWKPRPHKQNLGVEAESEILDDSIKEIEIHGTGWKPHAGFVADAPYGEFEAPPSYDELINQPTTVSIANNNSDCASYVFINFNP